MRRGKLFRALDTVADLFSIHYSAFSIQYSIHSVFNSIQYSVNTIDCEQSPLTRVVVRLSLHEGRLFRCVARVAVRVRARVELDAPACDSFTLFSFYFYNNQPE